MFFLKCNYAHARNHKPQTHTHIFTYRGVFLEEQNAAAEVHRQQVRPPDQYITVSIDRSRHDCVYVGRQGGGGVWVGE